MPQAIIFAVNWLAVQGAISVATAVAIGTFAATYGSAVLLIGGLAYSSAKARQAKQQAKEQYNAAQVDRMVNVSSTVAPRELVLGRVRKGGAVFYKASTGAVNRTMFLAIALAGHEIDAIETIYLNDTPVELGVNGEVLDAPYFSGGTSYCKITKHLGAPGQTVDADLLAAFPDDWTSANVVEGVAYLVVKMLYSETAYPSGMPNVTAIVRGAKLYDPRTATTVWSENPALMMRHVYQHEKFGKATVSAAEDARFIAVANACDQLATYTVGGVAQPTRPLYTAAIVAPFGAAPRSLLDDLAQSMGGSWAFAGGAIYLKPGVYSAPVLALTDADLAVVQRNGAAESQQPISIGVHAERAQKFNTVKATIWDAAQDYKQTVLSDLVGAALVVRDGVPLVQEVTFPAVGYAPQALHIAGIMMRDARDALTVDIPVKLRAYPLELFDTITLTLSRYGWSAKTFMVLGRSWNPDGSIRLTLKETAAAITQMDAGFVPQGYAANTNLPIPWDVPLVGPLTITSGDAEALTQADGSIISRLRISWPQVQDAAVVSNGQVEVQFRALGSTGPWTSLVTAGNETTVVTSDVQDGTTYTVRARARTSVAIGQWSSTSSSDVYGKTTAPPAATATAEGGMFQVILNWAFGDSTIDLRGTEVWWSATNDRATAARLSFEPFPGTRYQHIGLSAGQGGYYWLRVVNSSSVVSPWYPSGATAGLYAVASANPSALLTQLTDALGADQLAAGLVARIDLIDGNTTQPALAYPLVKLAALQDGLNQQARLDLDQYGADMLEAVVTINQTQQRFSDAGVYVDPADGLVKIAGIEAANSHLNTVDVTLSAHTAAINLRATTTYVDGAIASATLSPADLILYDGLNARMGTAEADINAVEATVALKSSVIDLTAATDRITTAEVEIDALQGQIVSKVDTSEFDTVTGDLTTRMGSAETTLSAIGDTAAITSMVVQGSRQYRDDAEAAELALLNLLNGVKSDDAQRETLAYAREELTAYTDAGVVSEAAQRSILAARLDLADATNAASVISESNTRATQTGALASRATALEAAVVDIDGTLATKATISYVDQAEADAISAAAATTALVSARLDTGDFAAVKTESSATASALGDVEARWGVQVQTMADGKRVLAGLQILAGTDGESSVGILADKLFVYKPDGTGAPIQMIVLGTVNGVTALGVNGNLLVDGSVVASKINATNLDVVDGTFSGTLNAATGTFAGSLSAATGTFSGTMTASAVNAVNTINLAGNSVSAANSAGGATTASTSINVPAGQSMRIICLAHSASLSAGGTPAFAGVNGVFNGVSYAVDSYTSYNDGSTYWNDATTWVGYASVAGPATVTATANGKDVSITLMGTMR